MIVGQVEGKEAPGPLFDFGLLMFHCGKTLFENLSGPFFYLSKVRHHQSGEQTTAVTLVLVYSSPLLSSLLSSRWRTSWRLDYGTKYLSGHKRRLSHVPTEKWRFGIKFGEFGEYQYMIIPVGRCSFILILWSLLRCAALQRRTWCTPKTAACTLYVWIRGIKNFNIFRVNSIVLKLKCNTKYQILLSPPPDV